MIDHRFPVITKHAFILYEKTRTRLKIFASATPPPSIICANIHISCYPQVLFFSLSTFRLGTTSHLLAITTRHKAAICHYAVRLSAGAIVTESRTVLVAKGRTDTSAKASLQLADIIVSLLPVNKQPWTCHGLHKSWASRQQESFMSHGQLTSADIGDSCYFHGPANVG